MPIYTILALDLGNPAGFALKRKVNLCHKLKFFLIAISLQPDIGSSKPHNLNYLRSTMGTLKKK